MADILKYRKLDGTEVEVANGSTIALGHTEASVEFTVDLDQFGVLEGETRGWFALAPVLSVPQTSNVYGLTIAPNQGQTVSVTIQTVDAKNLDNLQNKVFTRFSDTFTISVVRGTAPADSVADSNPVNFISYPDSAASIAIVDASFKVLTGEGIDSATTFGIVDSAYIHLRQNRDFDFLINLPKSIDSAGITRSLFDSDVRKSISVTDAGGDGSLTYNNSTGIITYTGPSASEVRSHFSAGGDLSYDSATGIFQFDVEQVYTKANFDSDFNVSLDEAALGGFGLGYNSGLNVLFIDSQEIDLFYRQHLRGHYSAVDAGGDGSFSYDSSRGRFTYTGPSASEVRSHFSAGGDLSYDSSTGRFQFDVEQVYTKANFDSDFNMAMDDVVIKGDGLKYNTTTNELEIDSAELSSYFRQDIRGYFSAQGDLSYDSATGVFSFDVEQVYTKANFDSDFNVAIDSATTSDLSEGSNLYYTDARADARIALQLGENLDLSNQSTSELSEDSSNLYYTDARADSAARSALVAVDAGGDGSFTYDSATGKFTYTGPSPSEIRSHFSGQGDLTYDSATGVFSFDVEQVYTKANFDSDFNVAIDSATTSDLSEGANLYYTTARADSAARSALIAVDAGGDGSFTYDSATGKFTYTGPSATEVRDHFTGGTGITISSGDIKIDSSELTSLYRQTIRTYLNVVDAGGDGSFAYDSALGKFTYTGPSAGEVRAHLTANKGLSVSSGEFNIDSANVRGMFSGGTGVTYTNGSGVIAIGQPVGTTDSVTFAGMTVSGNLQVNGTTTTVNSTTLDVADKNITIAKGAVNAAAADGGGITVDGANATLTYAATGDKFVFNKPFEGSFLGSDSDFDARLATKTTTNLAEGNNLYYTTARADSAARSALIAVDAGGDGSFAYDSATGKFTYTGPSATEVRNHFTGGDGIAISAGDIRIDSSELTSLYRQTIRTYVSAVSSGGDGSLEYNNITGVFTYSGPTSAEVRAHFTADKGLNYNSTNGNFDIDSANIRSMFSAGGDLSYNSGTGQFSFDVEQVYTKANFDSDFNVAIDSATTSDLSEGTNLYYTNARADARVNLQTGANLDLSQKSTSDLAEGTNKYYTKARVDSDFDASFALASTDSLSEGSTNLYFTNERVDDRVGALITGGVNVTATYDDAAGTLEIKVPFENIDDRVGNILTAGSGININYDDPNATITIANIADSAYITSLPVSTFANDKNYLDSTYASALIDSAHIKAVVDSAYVQLIQADLQRDSGFISSVITGGTLNMGANNIITTGKVLFANMYSTEGDLPNATTYHGMFAHVHATGAGYFAHGGNWIKLANNSQLSNSSNWDTAYSWGNHASAGYQLAATALDSAMVYRFTIDSTRTSALVDAAYVQARQIQYNTSDFLDSTTITGVVNNAYVQARQTSYNTSDFTDSAFVTGLPISTFTNDANYLDSTTITGVVNNAYVRARQALIDSDLTKLLVDSAYIQLRDRFQDSSLVTSTVDSSYVQTRVPETYLSTIIDSAYVIARGGAVLDSASIASGVIVTTVDAAYVQARQIQYNTSDFLDSTTVTGVIDSAYLLNTGFTVAKANQVFVDESEDDDVYYNLIFENTNPSGNGYSQMQVDNGVLTFNPDTNNLFNLGPITSRGLNNTVGGLIQIQNRLSSINDGQALGSIEWSAPSETSGGDAVTVAAAITAEADATFTSTVNSTDLVFKLGTSGTATAKARLTHEGTFIATAFSGDGSALTGITAGLDSALTTQLIDSAYIALRTTAGTDSATVISLIDSDYVGARVSGVVAPQFTDFRYKADSGQTLFSGADLGGASLNLRADNFNVYLNGIKLIDSDFTASVANNTITLTEGADSGDDIVITTIEGDIVDATNVVDSAYVQARQEGVNATFKDFKFVATSNQTVFSGNDANGTALSFETNKFHVLLNGIRLDASDFTESADNNKITLAAGAAADDELIVSTIGTEKTTTLASITSTVDSAYVQARQADIFRDSAFVTGIIDSAYIEPLLTPIHIDGNSNVGVGTTSVENTYSQSHTVEIAGRATDNNWGGSLILSSNNQTNVFARLVSSTDGLDLINAKNTNIRFFTNNTHRMTIAGNGQVVLNPVTAIDPTLRINQSNNTRAVQFNTAGVERGNIRVFDTGIQYNTTSDYRLKENVVTDWDATTRLKQLKPSRFNFIADSSKTLDGFLAHEVSSVIPEAVSGEKDAVDSDKNPMYQGIDQSKLVPLLTKALQEAVAKIETLEAKVAALEGGG